MRGKMNELVKVLDELKQVIRESLDNDYEVKRWYNDGKGDSVDGNDNDKQVVGQALDYYWLLNIINYWLLITDYYLWQWQTLTGGRAGSWARRRQADGKSNTVGQKYCRCLNIQSNKVLVFKNI